MQFCLENSLLVAVPILLLLFTIAARLFQKEPAQTTPQRAPQWWLDPWLIVFIVALFLIAWLFLHLWFQYKNTIFSPEWPFKFQESFDNLEDERHEAAQRCLEFLNKGDWSKVDRADGVDPILDFFEDLGFYIGNWGFLCEETLHHHFYHWARAYLQVTDDYRKEKGRTDPACWNHCQSLLDKLSEVESLLRNRPIAELLLSKQMLESYLKEELKLNDSRAISNPGAKP